MSQPDVYYVALVPIDFEGVRAYQPGDKVPAPNVELHGYVVGEQVEVIPVPPLEPEPQEGEGQEGEGQETASVPPADPAPEPEPDEGQEPQTPAADQPQTPAKPRPKPRAR
jgi:hypothetical protein